jgi:alpha-tubulin suppressor-like RCC1 family protein
MFAEVVVGWSEVGRRVCASVAVALTGTACSDIATPETLRRLAASQRTCLITDTGEVQCVPSRQPRPQEQLPAAAIDIDLASHACAVLASGAVACWGDDADGKLGAPSTTSDREPVIIDVGDPFIQASVSDSHTCAVTQSGALWCWGSNSDGQLGHADPQNIGDDETAASTSPVALAEHVVAVEANYRATCVVFDDGRARCWGAGLVIPDDDEGRLPASVPDLPLPESIVALSGGRSYMCALSTTGNVYCWGSARAMWQHYSNSTLEDTESPRDVGPVALGEPALEISAGHDHTCARLDGGRAKCWGNSELGKLGLGKPGGANGDGIAREPAIDVGGDVITIAAGQSHTCALLDDETVRCWGDRLALGVDTPSTVNCYDSSPFPNPQHGDPPTIETFDCTNDPACCLGDDEHPATLQPFFVEPTMQ